MNKNVPYHHIRGMQIKLQRDSTSPITIAVTKNTNSTREKENAYALLLRIYRLVPLLRMSVWKLLKDLGELPCGPAISPLEQVDVSQRSMCTWVIIAAVLTRADTADEQNWGRKRGIHTEQNFIQPQRTKLCHFQNRHNWKLS